MVIIALLLIPFLTALLVPFSIHRFHSDYSGWLLALVPFLMLLLVFSQTPLFVGGQTLYWQLSWFKDMNIMLAFKIDGLSHLFLLLIFGIGLPITVYSKPYFGSNPYLNRYFFLLFFFMASMAGAVMADDLITLFVFWELTSICSFLLIGLNHENRRGRKAAIEALFMTSIGGICLLVAFILLAQIAETQHISKLMDDYTVLNHHPYFPWILGLFLIGAFTKSAQFPFGFWLAGAMRAPTPVSAYLHSATMVQLGIYLLGRFHPLFVDSPVWFVSLTTVGGITMLTSVLAAFRQFDIKRILAYTTITALGSLVFTLAISDPMIIKASVSFILVHGLYKATLFMAVGVIQHETGTRHLNNLGGLYRLLPVTFLAVCVAGASMAGLPPLLGFYVKELVYEASLNAPLAASILTFIVVMANMMMAAIAFILIVKPFLGSQQPLHIKPKSTSMAVNALLLALITLFLSIFPRMLDYYVLSPAVETILQQQSQIGLTPGGEGLTPSLLLSFTTYAGALLIYLFKEPIRRFLGIGIISWQLSQHILGGLLGISLWAARYWTALWQSGFINRSILWVFLSIALLFIGSFHGLSFGVVTMLVPSIDWLLILWLMATAVGLLFVKRLLSGLIALGCFGLGLAFYFVVQGAPDLSITQALVETLMVIIIVFSLTGLKPWPNVKSESPWHRLTRGGTAIALSCFTALELTQLVKQPFKEETSRYFIKDSIQQGHAKNIVNKILVDFRAMDTLGETVVVLCAAIGVYFLLKPYSRRK